MKNTNLEFKSKMNNRFLLAKQDIKMAWDNPVRGRNDRISGEWIYSADKETHVYAKMLWDLMTDGNTSLYSVMVLIMNTSNLESFLKNNCLQ